MSRDWVSLVDRVCPACGGDGTWTTADDSEELCIHCDGLGKVSAAKYRDLRPDPTRDGEQSGLPKETQ